MKFLKDLLTVGFILLVLAICVVSYYIAALVLLGTGIYLVVRAFNHRPRPFTNVI